MKRRRSWWCRLGAHRWDAKDILVVVRRASDNQPVTEVRTYNRCIREGCHYDTWACMNAELLV